jgi:predicted metalloprotease with PDZ domain
MGTRALNAETDAKGEFRLEGLVPSSTVTVWLTASPGFVQERTEVSIPSGRPKLELTFRLLPRTAVKVLHDGGVGLFLSRRGNRPVVTGLTAFGPAEQAGIVAGDAILAVGKRDVSALGPGAIDYLLRGQSGSEVELTVQTAKQPPRKLILRRR